MDPERVRAYLQVACTGLGFDIGEVWYSSSKSGSSTVAQIEELSGTTSSANGEKKKIKFLQLYTSKSFDERRSELVLPPSERKRGEASVAADDQDGFKPLKRGNSILSPAELEKHVLSPRLVEAISSSAAVVWANCDESGGGGLIGRSDMHLQTAVGIPVAIDDEGNMCIVVMFSPKNMQSSDDAMEYLKAVSKSATSSSIPCLLPVVDRANNRLTAQPANESKEGVGGPSGGSSSLDSHNVPSSAAMHVKGPDARQDFGHGVKARFVSLTEDEAEIRNVQDVTSAPKDCYGIPMLPSFAELGSSPPATTVGERPERDLDHDAFDEASYGVWSTVMGNVDSLHYRSSSSPASTHYGFLGLSPSNIFPGDTDFKQQFVNSPDATSSKGIVSRRPFVQPQLKVRLEEFLSAFLGMSVFDLADVWIPCSGEDHDTLAHVTSVIATNSIESDEGLEFFRQASQGGLIKKWSGAVGRAYGSGSPVWTTSRSVFADSYRSDAFETARVQTALAVPILSAGTYTPACIICCYSQVREVSVPFVLKFLQQALRLVWGGLDRVEPHESVGKEMWNDVAPADLGEMAADVEMQQAFLTKKRPHDVMTSSVPPLNSAIDIRGAGGNTHERKSSLTLQLESLQVPQEDATEAQKNASPPRHALEIVVQEAVRSVENVVLWSTHQAVATNEEGTKRAHITATEPTAPLPQFPQYPPPTTSVKEDPAVAIANIKEFNTMAMHGISQQTYQETSSSSQAWVSNPIPDQASSGGHLGRISSMPLQCQPVAFGGPSQENAILGAKLCRIQGCNSVAVSKRPYCTKHSGNRLCEHEGCAKCAQGSTRFCIAHGGGRRCTFLGCEKGARDKFFCAAHGGGKRCKHDGCTKSAVGGSNLCTSHGGGRRCALVGCNKSAQSSTKFCVKHGGGKKCSNPDCKKVARGRTAYCAAHGGGVRCKLEGCNRVAIGKLQLCRAHGGGSNKRRVDASTAL